MTQNRADHATIAERLGDVAQIEEALKRAGRQAVLEHARGGRRIPVWRNNQVVWEKQNVDGGKAN